MKDTEDLNNKNKILQCPYTGLNIITPDEWTGISLTSDYSVSFRIIGKSIMMIETKGTCGPLGISGLLQKISEFKKSTHFHTKPFILLHDFRSLSGVTDREVRSVLKQYITTEMMNGNILGYFGFNVPFMTRLLFNLGCRPDHASIPVKIVNDYREAITHCTSLLEKQGLLYDSHIFETLKNARHSDYKVRNDESFPEFALHSPTDILNLIEDHPDSLPFKNLNSTTIVKYINDFLNYVSHIEWNKRGSSLTNIENHEKNPLKHLYEMMEIIKHDFDSVFVENQKINRELLLQNRYSRLRTDIWKLAADDNISVDNLVEKIIQLLGPALNVSRACFNEFEMNGKDSGDLVCTHEWCNIGVKPTLGTKLSFSIVKHFFNSEFTELTVDKALSIIPEAFRQIVRPAIQAFADSQNLYSIFIIPFKEMGHLKGWFTLDICNDLEDKPVINGEVKVILKEVSNIISMHITKKVAENKLHVTLSQMEHRIEERTRELTEKNKMLLEKDNEILNKNTILETSLDILSHDTKNIFFNIYVLMQQAHDMPMHDLIKENIDELFELMMETTSFMKSKKRIYSLVELFEKIRITNERIYLNEHKRIVLTLNNAHNLFIESSNLFKNAISNIIENALKYSPDDKMVTIEALYENRTIYIKIKDEGKGIPTNEKQKILTRYYRGEKTRHIEGSGKGLWITRNVLNKEGANLYINNNKPVGTVFTVEIAAFHVTDFEASLGKLSDWFDIPLEVIRNKAETIEAFLHMQYEGQVIEDIQTVIFTSLLVRLREDNREKDLQQINKRLSVLKDKNKGNTTVLIADDSIFVHYYLGTFITNIGFKVLDYAKNGEEAIFLYKKYKPDIITLDNTMPRMTGVDAAQELFLFDPDVKIIFISAVGDNTMFKEQVESVLPPENYITILKPINKEELKKALLHFSKR